MLGTIVLIVLVLMLLGAIPAGPHSREGGEYYPSGGIGLIVMIMIILLLVGRI